MDVLHLLGKTIDTLLFEPGSISSAYSFFVAFCVATLYLFLRRRRRNLRLLKATVRRLLPARLWTHRSSRLDVGLFLCNSILFPGLILLAVLSYEQIGAGVYGWLSATLGAPSPPVLPGWACSAITTLVLFIAYEFAYWVDHMLSHKIPFLWEFHRVHHSASVLTPLTNWRVHPIDTLIFFNIIALSTGSAQALIHYALGLQAAPYVFQGSNVIFLIYLVLYGHLQHSHVWMTFGGSWSKVLMSPAAHQVHHSTDPKHFDKNFGGALSLWDWLFGTLYMPAGEREVPEVGLKDDKFHDGLLATLFYPFAAAIRRTIRPLIRSASLHNWRSGYSTAGKRTSR
jgi:sterol desaturase/sphingolipid hydroxylase (fatty acid hydroxylase superfamily)